MFPREQAVLVCRAIVSQEHALFCCHILVPGLPPPRHRGDDDDYHGEVPHNIFYRYDI